MATVTPMGPMPESRWRAGGVGYWRNGNAACGMMRAAMRTEPRDPVLLVEDEIKVARFIVQGLQEEGYEVGLATTSAEAEKGAA